MTSPSHNVDGATNDEWQEIVVRPAGFQLKSTPDASPPSIPSESVQDRIIRFTVDEEDIKRFQAITFSPTRHAALRDLYQTELDELAKLPFGRLSQDEKVDCLLLKQFLNRELQRGEMNKEKDAKVSDILPFLKPLIGLVEARQNTQFSQLEPQAVAQKLQDTTKVLQKTTEKIEAGGVSCDRMTGLRAVKAVQEISEHLDEFYGFFHNYDPLFDWWVTKPYQAVKDALVKLVPVVEVKLAGMRAGDKDEIIGDAIGRKGLLAELEAEVIPYTPEELLVIAKQKFAWCETEAKKAAAEMGFGDDWKAALEQVKKMYLGPGEQPSLIKYLVEEGAEYVKSRDLVTVPAAAETTWRMQMMSAAAQKVNPFFLGGDDIFVSYPTSEMAHADKLMSMRGNNRPMARATAFHEMIPGHHLQLFMSARHRPYRRLFSTPFIVEGWALYWEMRFWNNGDFFLTPEDKIGTLFWRMHRCARILFSLKFHLGQLSPQECVDLLVDMVGHERATAEGEVRRSLNGDYSPLYQAGYMLGAIQLHALREEVLGAKLMGEKEFHDRVLRSSEMPIEMMRALLLKKHLTWDFKANWKFEGDVSASRRKW